MSNFVARIRNFFEKPDRKARDSNVDSLASSSRYKHWYSIFQKRIDNAEVESKVDEKLKLSTAIIKLCLDNLMDAADLNEIIESHKKFINRNDFESLENCQFCSRKSRLLDQCCPIKELQLDVFKRAINETIQSKSKMKFINQNVNNCQLFEEGNWISSSSLDMKDDNVQNIPSNDTVNSVQSKENSRIKLDMSKGKPTLEKLRKKLNNIRQFYPNLFYTTDNIVELWSRDDTLQLMTFEFLDFDRNSNYVWI